MPAAMCAITATTPRDQAAITKRSKPIAGADGRSAPARRLRVIEAEFAAPFGGVGTLEPALRLRVQSAATLSLRLEQVRTAMAQGVAGTSDEDLIRLTNAVSRAVAVLDRLTRAVSGTRTPSLAEYLASKTRAEATA